ncbi:MAG TPA: hypothetical protein VHA54_10945 [Solirubrobacterales bacterium]|nr:hypothetical protein [Solirubrobacterales bacterium]
MRFGLHKPSAAARRRSRRTGLGAAKTLEIASQMALLCPSGMDSWIRHELTWQAGEERRGAGAP